MTAEARQAAALVRARAPEPPSIGLILGSGLAGLADAIAKPMTMAYAELPGFPRPGVEGHAGTLVLGELAGARVACLRGRAHAFEGDAAAMLTPVRTLKLLGCEILVVTNAAGCLVADWEPGSPMLLADHINLQPGNPLVGANDGSFGPRFPDMSEAYDADLRERFRRAARSLSIVLHEGVYLACTGPCFETPAEIRAFRALGADAVGMSTAPEVVVARHCGLRVVGLSVLTNLAAGMTGGTLSHEETLAAATAGAEKVGRLLAAVIGGLCGSP